MSKLEYEPEALHRVLDGHDLEKQDAIDIATNFKSTAPFVFKISQKLRNSRKGNVISFSKKSFFNDKLSSQLINMSSIKKDKKVEIITTPIALKRIIL